jgi:hypothetical protein
MEEEPHAATQQSGCDQKDDDHQAQHITTRRPTERFPSYERDDQSRGKSAPNEKQDPQPT